MEQSSTSLTDRPAFPRFRAAALCAAALLLWVVPARLEAATFTVDPTQIFLSGRTGSALLTLRNESTDAIRFQLSVFAWDQSSSGEMQLEATRDIVFFPSLLTLGPGETRRVRVGMATRFGDREKTYRIFVEELPPADPSAGGVRVLTKMGIPIFLRPSKEQASAALSGVGRQDDRLRFTLANTGTVHFVPQNITVRGLAGSTATFTQQLQGWYVLAGGRREFDMALPDTQCAQVTAIVVEIQLGANTLEERLQTPGGACPP